MGVLFDSIKHVFLDILRVEKKVIKVFYSL